MNHHFYLTDILFEIIKFMNLFFNFSYLENRDTLFKKLVLFFIVSSVMLVIILDSNFLMGFLQEKLLPFNNKIIIFSIYVFIFGISNLLLLMMTYSFGSLKEIEVRLLITII